MSHPRREDFQPGALFVADPGYVKWHSKIPNWVLVLGLARQNRPESGLNLMFFQDGKFWVERGINVDWVRERYVLPESLNASNLSAKI